MLTPRGRTGKPVQPPGQAADTLPPQSGQGSQQRVSPRRTQATNPTAVFPEPQVTLTRKARSTTRVRIVTIARDNLTERNWFHSLFLSAISGTFNSLFKVLFTFPSRYLFAIGLEPIFSFRRRLPPILHTMSKVRDSKIRTRTRRALHMDGDLTLLVALFQRNLCRGLHWGTIERLQFRGVPQIYRLSFSRFSRPY